jgi:hypothetical protein
MLCLHLMNRNHFVLFFWRFFFEKVPFPRLLYLVGRIFFSKYIYFFFTQRGEQQNDLSPLSCASIMNQCYECNESSCMQPVHGQGLCVTHYNKRYNEKKRDLNCTFEGCDEPQRRRSLCSKHYRLLDKCGFCKKKYSGSECNCQKIKSIMKCSYPDCKELEIFNKKMLLCTKHYFKMKRKRDDEPPKIKTKESKKDESKKVADYRSFIIT